MVDAVSSARAGAAPAANDGSPQNAGDWAKEILSWASPSGVILHAVRPVAADALRRSEVGRGTEWGDSLQRMLDNPASVRGFQAGMAEGVWNGAKSMVGGVVDLAKMGINLGPVGMAGDAARGVAGLFGRTLPDWVPSHGAEAQKLRGMGEGVGRYLSEVAQGRANLGDDIKGWIGANWDSLKADHAAAVAKGPEAEAQWWGQVAGRATFEVAAVVVPASKFASVAKAGEALEMALKAGKLGETIAEAARVGKLGELFGAAQKAGKLGELVAEARTAGRLGELVAESRKITGGLRALAEQGRLGFDDINRLVEAKSLSVAETRALRVAEASRQTGIPVDELNKVLDTPKGARPAPESYMSPDRIARELAKYDEGAVRFTSRKSLQDRGTLGPPGGFVMPYREFADLVKSAGGDLRIVENKLGLTRGYLSDADTMIARIKKSDFDSLRLPSGNERGANDNWIPGGITSGGVSEATLDFPKGTPYTELHLKR